MKLLWTSVFLLLILVSTASAYEYQGRFLLGGYAATERFSESTEGSNSNDSSAISSRFYLDVTRWGDRNLEWIFDLRDKHDFFDKLDRERLELKAKNRFQLRQLVVKLPPSDNTFYGSFGRFSIAEAGGVFADGAEAGWALSRSTRAAVFGGLSPKSPDKPYVEFTTDSRVVGAYVYHQPVSTGWEQFMHLSNALVLQEREAKVDRAYWYENAIYQPSRELSLMSLSYLDFQPSLRLQNFSLSANSDHFRPWSLSVGYQVIDSIEYHRRQSIREKLDSSPYQEGYVRTGYYFTDVNVIEFNAIGGRRSQDGKLRQEGSVSSKWLEIYSAHYNAQVTLGYRRQFVSHDYFTALNLGYYSQMWDLSLRESAAYESYDHGDNLVPVTSELSACLYLSKAFYGALSLEHAIDSDVNIFSAAITLGYRFGTRELPATRDTAPGGGRSK